MILLFLAAFLAVPQWTVPQHVPVAGAGLSCPGSDSFSGSGALSPCWTSPNTPWSLGNTPGTAQQASGFLVAGGSGATFQINAALYTGGTTPNAAAAEITVSAMPSPEKFYLCVRGDTAGDGYCWNEGGGDIVIVTAGTASFFLGGCGSAVVGDTYKLDADAGNNITLTNLTTSTVLCGPQHDSTWTSGFPVIVLDLSSGGNAGTSGIELSNFQVVTP